MLPTCLHTESLLLPLLIRQHIDQIMSSHGKQILQAVTLILEAEHSVEVKEQTLCILANIADGNTAKEILMTNDDMLQKIKYYMGHSNVKLQLAATFCVSNLIWNEEDVQAVVSSDCSPKGSQERQDKLREMGFVDILHKLTQASDPNLCDRAKTAMQQYLA
ncbi:armadillo repeat-containing protein 8 isoform X2 [Gymnodraco acuticeps]|uniref:Armadillo repeat-containing protein 8 isoform X2 n=1 Tax=Gymnodraco acuticeps TaxID=8218 RepID=A0A6P8SR91_GYMAC|nr:armadillo repeat-containing protein 8 isoform X2 [Gymnodraco acuticeps]